jgi:hypothetical protein
MQVDDLGLGLDHGGLLGCGRGQPGGVQDALGCHRHVVVECEVCETGRGRVWERKLEVNMGSYDSS